MLYLWLKAFHIMSVIAWMAAMFYLPRLFVYHAQVPVGSEQSELFKVMERRLLKAIMTPAMIASWVFGLWLAIEIGAFSDGWFHAKLTLVLVMSGVHGYLAKCTRSFAADANTKGHRHYRIVNEIPTVLMIGIVLLVVLKPF
ncbi:MAG: TIGR00701 family protein [Stappia sp.]|jgi:putative membrane protein|uniref:protoporphyrinogen oxidase HemJ n=1 Tax=Stappia sp. TaxID=1870903 RepID=UPI000C5CC69C|nr:protoporphyrinogen oxidase HemJ [Stappia sp.]MAA99007.1 TIGR00701 family protein [Stappia sp.]MBM18425.1 TIGR00701 family protein [Stappia sp.]|tara:strand:+ start:171 stop:596 length:426 start_codon:yes stop_codon:yes gene_type:complete